MNPGRHAAYLAIGGAVGWAAVLVAAATVGRWPDWRVWAIYAAAAVVAETVVVPLPRGALQSLGAVSFFAAIVALGPVPAALVAAVGVGIGNGVFRRRPLLTTWFNTGQLALAILCAGFAYGALRPGDLRALRTAGTLAEAVAGPAPMLAAGLAAAFILHVGISDLAVSIAGSLRERRPLRETFLANVGWELIGSLPQATLGAIIGLVATAAVLPIALTMIVPLGLVSYALLLYRGREHAHGDLGTLYQTAVDLASSMSLAERLRVIRDAAARLVGGVARIAVVDPRSGEASYVGEDGHAADLVLSTDLARQVLDRRRVVVDRTRTRYAVGAPFIIGEDVVGAIVVERDSEPPSLPGLARHEQALQALAQSAALAIRNAHLFEESRRTVDRLTALQRLGEVVNSTLDLDQVFNAFTTMATAAVGADGAGLGLYDPRADALTIGSVQGIAAAVFDRPVPVGADTAWSHAGVQAFRERRCVLRDDLTPETAGPVYGPMGARSVLAAPVIARGDAIGVLTVYALRARAFGPDETSMLQAIADQGAIAIENARLYREAKDAAAELRALHQATEAISSSLELPAVLQAIVLSACQAFRYDFGTIGLIDEATGELVMRSAYGYRTDIEAMRLPPGRGVTGWVARTGQPLVVPDVSKEPRYISADDSIRSELAVPLIAEGRVIGVFNVESTRLDAFGERDVRILELLSRTATIAIENARLYEEARRLATTDGLTGLHNHRYLHEQLEAEVERARRYGHPLSLVMFEVDRFKRYNDTYGHRQGDVVLRVIAQLLTVSSRSTDVVARYGGDEFTIVMPHTTKDAAHEAAERIRRAVETYPFNLGDGASAGVTLSSGIAAVPDDALTADALIEGADRAMYRAKRSGGNTVHLAPA